MHFKLPCLMSMHKGGWHGNALQAALSEGCETMGKLLLEMNADVNAQGGGYENASEGSEPEMGANVNTQGGDRRMHSVN